jgi:hypothetical protein
MQARLTASGIFSVDSRIINIPVNKLFIINIVMYTY